MINKDFIEKPSFRLRLTEPLWMPTGGDGKVHPRWREHSGQTVSDSSRSY